MGPEGGLGAIVCDGAKDIVRKGNCYTYLAVAAGPRLGHQADGSSPWKQAVWVSRHVVRTSCQSGSDRARPLSITLPISVCDRLCYRKLSLVPKCSCSKRRRSQKRAKMSAKESKGKGKSTKELKRSQKGAKERKRR